MTRRLRVGLIIGIAVVLALAAVVFFKARGNNTSAEATVAPLEFLPTDILTVQPSDLQAQLPLTGTLNALQQAAVRAKVSGELSQVLVREGESVKQGQVIARLDTTEYDARVAQARGQMLAAKGEFDKARQVMARNRDLVTRGFISQTAFENYEASTKVAQANLDAANGGLAVAQKALADTVITAPFDGMVALRAAEPGEKVSPDAKLFDIVNLSRLELAAAIPLSEAGNVRIGQAVELRAEGTDAPISGALERINPAAAEGTRSIMVYVSVANPDGRLRAGQFVTGGLVMERRAQVLAIPTIAVRTEGERHFVYAIDAQGQLIERVVQTGLRSADQVEITGGLEAGTRIVRNNLGTLRTGTPVVVKGS
jgi:membrane fusion protein (multidrug efflux system)